ncbi:MAG TPA: YSC84-related protein [Syntrophorhabdaceae bacterium]|jgi:lipid-binding SYLF domain-containing protein
MRRETVRAVILSVMILGFLGLASCATAPKTEVQKEEAQAPLRDMAAQTLAQLYRANPAAQRVVTNAAGYAVFTDFGFKLMFMGGVRGKGMAKNNDTKKETFMEMAELQPGLGLGARRFRAVMIFDTPEAYNKFVTSGWEFGADAMAAAKTKTEGGALAGAVTVSEGVHMYQITEEGLIAGVSITGAKYYKDKDLN